MFDEYFKKIEEIGANAPKVFETVAKKGAIHFRNQAVKLTDEEKLVDTGAYRRNWHGEAVKFDEKTYGVACSNSMEYASFLEYGHKYRNGKKWKGRFVGQRALDDTDFYCIEQLDDMFEKLYTQHQRGFTTPDSQ